jgi:citrate lyase subunit beta/citryl-CoA lyase
MSMPIAPSAAPSPVHPQDALHVPGRPLPLIAPCEHIAGNEKMIRKAIAMQRELRGAFDLTCDCEDGAAVGAEREHALMVSRVLNEVGDTAGRIGVRVHDITHAHWRDDVDVLLGEAASRIAYVTLPKAEGAGDVARMIDWIERRAQRAGRTAPLPVHVLVETHGALAQADGIAALPQVETLDFGLLDFGSAHHGALGFDAMRSPLQFEHPVLVAAKTRIVSAALAHGVVPVHNVSLSLSLRDVAAVASDARVARERFGFLRMWSIHPMQVRPIVEAMSPSHAEVERAGRILLGAQAAGWGPIDHDGDLHDRASYRHCWTVVRRAHAAGMTLELAVARAFF